MMTGRDAGFLAAWAIGGLVAFMIGFFGAFILTGVGASFVVEDVDAFMETPLAFGASLVLAFAAGGAMLGLGQALAARKRGVALSAWIGATAAGFAVLAVLFLALEPVVPRLVNEIVHNAAGGAVAGFLQVRFALARGSLPRAWIAVPAVGLVLTGLTAWAVEAGAPLESGEAAPLGILVYGLVSGGAFLAMTRATSEAR